MIKDEKLTLQYIKKLKGNRVTIRLDDIVLNCVIELQNKWLATPMEVIKRCIKEAYKNNMGESKEVP